MAEKTLGTFGTNVPYLFLSAGPFLYYWNSLVMTAIVAVILILSHQVPTIDAEFLPF